jgi:hypothetical protein
MTTIPTTVRPTNAVTTQPKDLVMKLSHSVQLINEALSRARMRSPQTMNSEAHRPARRIMMASRREHDRMTGL